MHLVYSGRCGMSLASSQRVSFQDFDHFDHLSPVFSLSRSGFEVRDTGTLPTGRVSAFRGRLHEPGRRA